MSEAGEVHAPKNPFEKRVALTIAILAAFVSVVTAYGQKSRTESIIKTNFASNKWAHYQAKSIKGHSVEGEIAILSAVAKTQPDNDLIGKLKKEIQRYEKEMEEIRKESEEIEKEAEKLLHTTEKCEISLLLLEIGIVLSSVAILISSQKFWYASIAAGSAGTLIGVALLLL